MLICPKKGAKSRQVWAKTDTSVFGVAKVTQPVLARIDSSRYQRVTILLQYFAAGQQLRLQI